MEQHVNKNHMHSNSYNTKHGGVTGGGKDDLLQTAIIDLYMNLKTKFRNQGKPKEDGRG